MKSNAGFRGRALAAPLLWEIPNNSGLRGRQLFARIPNSVLCALWQSHLRLRGSVRIFGDSQMCGAAVTQQLDNNLCGAVNSGVEVTTSGIGGSRWTIRSRYDTAAPTARTMAADGFTPAAVCGRDDE